MFLSIIVITYNRKELTKYCIETLIKNTPRERFELTVVDNCSNDGTIEMLNDLKNKDIIQNLILNPKNYFVGKAVNQGWKIANKEADWFLSVNNDFFFMQGWFQNFEKVVNDLDIDYISCLYLEHTMRNKVAPGISMITSSGGKYLQRVLRDRKITDVGGATAIKRSVVKKYKIKVPEGKHRPGYTGPAPHFNKILQNDLMLKSVRLDKPCILLQFPDYENPKYEEYYKEVYSSRGLLRLWEVYKNNKSVLKNPEKYYEGTNYLEERKKILKKRYGEQ